MSSAAPSNDNSQPVRYSTRNTRGRHVQRVLLDTARALLPALPVGKNIRATLGVNGDAASLRVTGLDSAQRARIANPACRELVIMADALARQIARLTGARAFDLTTWDNNLPTQPVHLTLHTVSGAVLELFNSTASANRYFHALIDLSIAIEDRLGADCRTPQDIDALIDAGALRDWTAASRSNNPASHASQVEIRLPWGPESLRDLRARHDESALPDSLHQIEAYEASLAAGTVRQTSLWGQEGEEAARERTAARNKGLNPDLTADLVPLSRSIKETSIEDLIQLANARPLSHLAIEFGISDVAIRKRLRKAGWVSPRGWGKNKAA